MLTGPGQALAGREAAAFAPTLLGVGTAAGVVLTRERRVVVLVNICRQRHAHRADQIGSERNERDNTPQAREPDSMPGPITHERWTVGFSAASENLGPAQED